MRSSSADETRGRIGANVRAVRKLRGLTLATVAGLAGRSVGWLSQIERGLRSLDRRQDIAALAAALDVSPVDLLMSEGPPAITSTNDGVGRLREVLHGTAIDDPLDVEARSLPVLAALNAEVIAGYRHEARYAELIREAAVVLAELHVHANIGNEAERVAALRLIVDLATSAAFCLRHLGYTDLAWIAADRAHQAAAALADPIYAGAAWFGRAHARPSAGTARPFRLASTAAERIEPHLAVGDAYGHQVYGMLHLTAALAAQIHGDDPGMRVHLDEAERVAALIGERPAAWQNFGPANVQAWRVSIEVEAGQPSLALSLFPAIDLRPLGRNRRAALLLEVARAHAMLGRKYSEQAVQRLRQAERLAPDRIHHNPLARELVAALIDHEHRRAGGPTLRGLAYRMRIST